MPLYENDRNAENRIKVKKKWSDAVVFGAGETLSEMCRVYRDTLSEQKRSITVAFDGWYGVQWKEIIIRTETYLAELFCVPPWWLAHDE